MISLRQTSLAVAGAVLLTGLSPVYASTAKKHPKPSHPEAVHAKAQHPAPQKGTKHAAPKATHHTARKTKGHKRGQAAMNNQRERSQKLQFRPSPARESTLPRRQCLRFLRDNRHSLQVVIPYYRAWIGFNQGMGCLFPVAFS